MKLAEFKVLPWEEAIKLKGYTEYDGTRYLFYGLSENIYRKLTNLKRNTLVDHGLFYTIQHQKLTWGLPKEIFI